MGQYHSRSKNPKTILKGYRMFLMGYDDSALAYADINISEIVKIIKFHECMLAGQTFCVAGKKLGLSEHIAKRLWSMFCDSRSGKVVTYIDASRKNCPHVVPAYELLLRGAHDDEMRAAGCTELEIEKAKLFSTYADADMLTVTISRKTSISIGTIKRLQKMYKDKCKFSMAIEDVMMI